MARLCIVGTGHVGLVYAIAFTLQGHEVHATDVDAKAIASLQKGTPTFYEPGLKKALQKALRTKRLTFSTDVKAGARDAEAIFTCVGTPSREDGSIDLAYVEAAARTVGEIEAGAPARITAALAALREDHLRRARDEIATIEAELAALEGREADGPAERERFGQAVERVVSAVLGET